MTLRDAAKQFLVYQYARRGYSDAYWDIVVALHHLVRNIGNLPLSQVREKHFIMYFTVIVRDQLGLRMEDLRLRSAVSQSFWHWMVKNHMVR